MNNSGNKQIESNNLKVLKDQINHEALMNKKFSECANVCADQQIKSLCTESSQIHRQNFEQLKSYLDSHQ